VFQFNDKELSSEEQRLWIKTLSKKTKKNWPNR